MINNSKWGMQVQIPTARKATPQESEQPFRHPWFPAWRPRLIPNCLPLQVGSLEEENQELFNTATTSEEELDAVNGRLYAATNSLATAELRMHELEQRLQEALAAAPQHSEVSFFSTLLINL